MSSSIWKFFHRNTGDTTAKCKICNKFYSFKTSTTNLKKHLYYKHTSAYEFCVKQMGASVHDGSSKEKDNSKGLKTEELNLDDIESWVIDNAEPSETGSNSGQMDATQSDHEDASSQSRKRPREFSIEWLNEDEQPIDALEISKPFQVRKPKAQPQPKESQPLQVEPNQNDIYDKFGTYIASLLRSLPPRKALKLQPKIVQLIVSEEVSNNSDSD